MKIISILLLSVLSMPAFARTVQTEFGGTCLIHAYGRSDIFHGTRVPFSFPEVASVTKDESRGEKTEYQFGVGTAVINQDIEMMDANKKIIVAPFEIALTVKISPDMKRKKLSVVVKMFNIFTQRSETTVLEDLTIFNQDISGQFSYFQTGFNASTKKPSREEVIGSSVFCHFEDNGTTP